MKKPLLISVLVGMLSCYSCKESVGSDAEVIDFNKFKQVDNLFSDTPKYVILKNNDQSQMLSDISRIKIFNNKIYVVDANPRPYKIVEFDMEGNPLRVFLRQGRGPGEYLQITDFDITSDGTLQVIDGQSDRMCSYDSLFTFLSSIEVPVEMDMFKSLENGGFLVEYSSWVRDMNDNIQVAVVDDKFQNPKAVTRYDIVDDNFWLSDSYFVSTSQGVFHHRQISDDVRLLSPVDGRVLKQWHFDFGARTVPDDDKADVESNLDNFKSYITLVDFTVITDSHIYGGLFYRGEKREFFADRENNLLELLPEQFGRLAGTSGDTLICSLDIAMLNPSVSFPADVTAALENGDFVLALYTIK